MSQARTRNRHVWSNGSLAQAWGTTKLKRHHQPPLTSALNCAKRRSIQKRRAAPQKLAPASPTPKKPVGAPPTTPPHPPRKKRQGANFDHVAEEGRNCRWTPQQSQRLIQIVQHQAATHGLSIRWTLVSKELGHSKSARQCRERWQNVDDPLIDQGPWSPEEDSVVYAVIQTVYRQWSVITNIVNAWRAACGITTRRTGIQIKHRFGGRSTLSIARAKAAAAAAPTVLPTVQPPPDSATEDTKDTEDLVELNALEQFASSFLPETDDAFTAIVDHDWVAMLHHRAEATEPEVATAPSCAEASLDDTCLFAYETLSDETTDLLDCDRIGFDRLHVEKQRAIRCDHHTQNIRTTWFRFGALGDVAPADAIRAINELVGSITNASRAASTRATATAATQRRRRPTLRAAEMVKAKARTSAPRNPVPAAKRARAVLTSC